MEARSREEAISLGLTRYKDGTSCKHGHIAQRYTSSNNCCECNRMSVKRSRVKTGRKSCPGYAKQWRIDNPEKVKGYQRFRDRAKLYEKNVRKRAKTRQSTPPWVDEKMRSEISLIYELARDCTMTCGERYDVDHIIPIVCEDICGLHVPWNLQVLPMDINRSKQNKWSG